MLISEITRITSESLLSNQPSLAILQENPELLIPPRLTNLGIPTRAVAVPIWRGRFDNEYMPSLSAAVFAIEGINGTPRSEDAENSIDINKPLAHFKEQAVFKGLVSEKASTLLTFVANETNNSGIEIASLILAPEIRKQGVGISFYENFDEIIRNLGFRYYYGDHKYSTNPDFFIKRGRYPISYLEEDFIHDMRIYSASPHTTVKFLDSELEEKYLK